MKKSKQHKNHLVFPSKAASSAEGDIKKYPNQKLIHKLRSNSQEPSAQDEPGSAGGPQVDQQPQTLSKAPQV